MKQKSIFIIIPVLAILSFLWLGSIGAKPQDNFTETVKVALRETGHKLLLTNNDSTSLILPITKISDNRYEIAFQKALSISPDSLVSFIKQSLKAANLPKRYIVEVVNCNNNDDVSYSFQITGINETDIIPCLERKLPADCYTIQVVFLESQLPHIFKNPYFLLMLIIIVICWLLYKKKFSTKTNQTNSNLPYSKIGHYKFYKDQNKLIKERIEIKLSVKECELIAMLSANQNQVVKRDVLVKEIWEDNGVYVDRSLDTFISKLRKKFKDDPFINIVNIHGVGYKLEVK